MKRNLLITALLCSSGLYASAHSSAPIPATAGQTEAVAADYEYTGEMSINMSTGHFTAFSGNGAYASTWQSNKGWSNVPVVRLISFSNKKAQNNMDVAGSNAATIVAHRGGDSEYTLIVEKGYNRCQFRLCHSLRQQCRYGDTHWRHRRKKYGRGATRRGKRTECRHRSSLQTQWRKQSHSSDQPQGNLWQGKASLCLGQTGHQHLNRYIKSYEWFLLSLDKYTEIAANQARLRGKQHQRG